MLLMLSCGMNQSKEDKEILQYAKNMRFAIKSNDVKNADPAILFCYSSHLWNENKKDDAVFWYYIAQYRYRFLSSCSEHLKAGSLSETEAKKILIETGVAKEEGIDKLHLIGGAYRIDLYEAIQSQLGKTINGYGYGNLNEMKTTIDRMLDYQEYNPFNPMGLSPKPVLKSKEEQAEKIMKIKESYIHQKEEIDATKDEIRKTRLDNGLENRD
jgi:hypothetical protein